MYVVDGIAYAGKMLDDIKIVDAKVVTDLCLLVTFSTGEKRVFDAAPLVSKPAFAPLADEGVFADFAIDHGVLTWLNGDVDVSPAYVYKNSYEYEYVA